MIFLSFLFYPCGSLQILETNFSIKIRAAPTAEASYFCVAGSDIFQIGIQLSDLLSQLLHVIINVLSQISAYDQIIVKRHNQVMDRQRQMIQVLVVSTPF